jgi:two-component system response regulator RegX3
MSTTIVAILPDLSLRDAVTRHLRADEQITLISGASVEEGLALVSTKRPSLVILSRRPEEDGVASMCDELRRHGRPLVLCLAPGGNDAHAAAVLEAGADHYLALPCSGAELRAHIRALLRRQQAPRSRPEVAQIGDLRVDFRLRQVQLAGRPVSLPPKEFELLAALAEQAGRLVRRDELVRRMWGPGVKVKAATLDVHVFSLRSKIERDPSRPERVLTVRGVGYRLADGAEEAEAVRTEATRPDEID